jgi:hypothetical protein
MSEKVKTTYTNLSNEVLIKKINTYIKQIDE